MVSQYILVAQKSFAIILYNVIKNVKSWDVSWSFQLFFVHLQYEIKRKKNGKDKIQY